MKIKLHTYKNLTPTKSNWKYILLNWGIALRCSIEHLKLYPYSHSEIQIDDLSITADVFSNRILFFHRKPYSAKKWDTIELETNKTRDEILDIIHTEKLTTYKYDTLGIFFSHLLPLGIHSKKAMVCSEACKAIIDLVVNNKEIEKEEYTGTSPLDLYLEYREDR